MNWRSDVSPYPVFTHNLWRLLHEPSNSDIVDYEEGSKDVFVIKNVMDFTHLILPRYYKIDRLQTYYNHLERYGFKRLCESPPKWHHEKWDKNNKDCLNHIHKIHCKVKKFSSVPHHLRSNISPQMISEKLDEEIRKREALEREVSALKKQVKDLVAIVERKFQHQHQIAPGTLDQQNSAERNQNLKRSVSQSSKPPKKRRLLNCKIEETTVPKSPTQKKLLSDVAKCVNSNPGLEEMPMARPSSKQGFSKIDYDAASCKTETLQAQISWSRT
jgi:hypothetical protein